MLAPPRWQDPACCCQSTESVLEYFSITLRTLRLLSFFHLIINCFFNCWLLKKKNNTSLVSLPPPSLFFFFNFFLIFYKFTDVLLFTPGSSWPVSFLQTSQKVLRKSKNLALCLQPEAKNTGFPLTDKNNALFHLPNKSGLRGRSHNTCVRGGGGDWVGVLSLPWKEVVSVCDIIKEIIAWKKTGKIGESNN